MNMEDFISEAKRLSCVEKQARESFCNFCQPVLNVSYAGWLRERVKDRDVYLMVALRLFSPRSLAGRKIVTKGIRKALSKNMGINEWYVSRQIGEVTYLYDHIPKFKADVNKAYSSVVDELRENDGLRPNQIL